MNAIFRYPQWDVFSFLYFLQRTLRPQCLGLVVAVLVALPQVAIAGSLTGTLIESETLKGLPGAKISLVGTEYKTVSDKNGRFRLFNVAPNTYRLRITKEGYWDLEERLVIDSRNQRKNFVLASSSGEGEVIELREKAPLVVTTPGQTRIDREELVLVPGSRGDALQVLKNLPGVALATNPGSGPGLLVVRGAAPEDSLFLLDGVSIPLVYHFFGVQSILPSEFIDDIEYIPGGFGVEYGQSTGGIFQIHSRPARSTEWNGFAESSFINLAAYGEGPLGKNLNISMAVRRSTIDWIIPLVIPENSGINFTTLPSYYDAQLRLDYRPNYRHAFALFNIFSFDQLTLILEKENPNDPEASGKFDNETLFFRSIASWKYRFNKLDNDLTVALGRGHFHIGVGDDRYLRVKGYSSIARNNLVWRLHKKLSLKTGGNLFLNFGDADIRFPLPPQEGSGKRPNLTTDPIVNYKDKSTNHRGGAYIASEYMPTAKLTITTGLRYDRYDRISASTLSPRLSVKYEIKENLLVRLGVGEYSRTLSQAEAAPTDLAPERATQFVVGAELSRGRVKGSLSGFYTDRRSLVVQDLSRIEDSVFDAYVSRGYGASYGAELFIRAKFPNFFGWITYTLSRSTRVDGPRQKERLFDFDQTHNFVVVGSRKWGKWTFGGRWQYITGRPKTPIVDSIFVADLGAYIPVLGDVNSTRMEAAHQLDIRIDRKWTFQKWSLSAYLDVSNLYLNPKTLEYRYNFDFTEREAITELPILPAIGMRGTF